MGLSMPGTNAVVIKKYPNRRLYNTAISSYITLEELSSMVKKGEEFIVLDSKSGDDITRVTLTQIILEHETKGYNLLPLDFLKQLIKLYDNPIASTIHSYLSLTINHFMQNHERVAESMKLLTEGMLPFSNIWEDIAKQNQELFKTLYTKAPSHSSKKD